MGLTFSPITITNAFDQSKVVKCEALVDTGASYLTLPKAWKDSLGPLKFMGTVDTVIATQQSIPGDIYGPVEIAIEGFRPAFSEVLFIDMEPENGRYEPLLGCLALEAAGISVDSVSHRLMKSRVLARTARAALGRQPVAPVTSPPSVRTYREFTPELAQQVLGVAQRFDKLFDAITPVTPPSWVNEALASARSVGYHSDKARAEFLITPLLLGSRQVNGERFQLYPGQALTVDAARGLAGECDFILTHSEPSPLLHAPIMVIVTEAKKQDFERGLGECLAQLAAAQLFNQQHGSAALPVFGCVTSGDIWQFLKLEDARALIDHHRYYITEAGQILGVFKTIVDVYETRHKQSET